MFLIHSRSLHQKMLSGKLLLLPYFLQSARFTGGGVESLVQKTSRQKCRKREQPTKQWRKYNRTSGSVLEKNKITRLVFFLDDAWFTLSTYVTAKIKPGATKVVKDFVKFHFHHSQVDLGRAKSWSPCFNKKRIPTFT